MDFCVVYPRLQAKLEKQAGGTYFPNYANNLAEEQREIETSISFERCIRCVQLWCGNGLQWREGGIFYSQTKDNILRRHSHSLYSINHGFLWHGTK